MLPPSDLPNKCHPFHASPPLPFSSFSAVHNSPPHTHQRSLKLNHLPIVSKNPSSTTLSINALYSNFRSLKNKPIFYQTVQTQTYKLILCAETWLKPTDSNHSLIGSSPYQIIRSDRASRKGGGVAALIHNSIPFVPVNTPKVTQVDIISFDIVGPTTDPVLRIILIYRPPSTTVEYSRRLIEVLYELTSVHQPSVITGDLNLPEVDWVNSVSASTIGNDILSLTVSANFQQLVNTPTRGPNILDILLTNNKNTISNFSVSPPLPGCDHKTILFNIHANISPFHSTPTHPRPNFTKTNWDLVNSAINKINWNSTLLLPQDTPTNPSHFDHVYNNFCSLIHKIVLEHTPLFSPKPPNTGYPPHISKRIRHREYLWSKLDSSISSQQNFSSSTKILNKHLKKFRKQQELKAFQRNPNGFFNYISKFTKPPNHYPILTNPVTGSLVVTDTSKANLFADHFLSVYSPTYALNENTLTTLSSAHPNFFFLPPVSPLKILDLCKSLPEKANTSADGLSNIILCKCAIGLAYPISLIFNYSLQHGVVPSIWKHALVLPLFKKGDKSLPSNYRPISLTPPLSKLLERIVNAELTDFLTRNNYLPDEQHGFRKGKSTETNLLQCLDDWTTNMEKKTSTDIIYVDLKAAFDRVSIPKLIQTLSAHNINGIALAWFSNFLSNRTFQVTLNSSTSYTLPVTSGVPQGTSLAPTLFLLYISKLPVSCQTPNVSISLFADDIKFYTTSNNSTFLQCALNKLTTFCTKMELTVSAPKCSALYLNKSNPRNLYNIAGLPLPICTTMRDLGVLIDQNLSFLPHIRNIILSAKRTLFSLFRNIKTTSSKTLVKVYCIYVRPILDYCSSVYYPYKKTYINLIESVQRLATNIIFNRCFPSSPHISYPQRLEKLHIESLVDRRKLHDQKLFSNIIIGKTLIPANLYPKFRPSITRGLPSKVVIPFSHSAIKANSFTTRFAQHFK